MSRPANDRDSLLTKDPSSARIETNRRSDPGEIVANRTANSVEKSSTSWDALIGFCRARVGLTWVIRAPWSPWMTLVASRNTPGAIADRISSIFLSVHLTWSRHRPSDVFASERGDTVSGQPFARRPDSTRSVEDVRIVWCQEMGTVPPVAVAKSSRGFPIACQGRRSYD